jgi:hypothetical protein
MWDRLALQTFRQLNQRNRSAATATECLYSWVCCCGHSKLIAQQGTVFCCVCKLLLRDFMCMAPVQAGHRRHSGWQLHNNCARFKFCLQRLLPCVNGEHPPIISIFSPLRWNGMVSLDVGDQAATICWQCASLASRCCTVKRIAGHADCKDNAT